MKRISDLVLHKDHHIIVINKPSGLPSQQDQSGQKNAHQLLMAYAHRDLYPVHRLDQRVSGVLLFTRTKEAAAFLSKIWNEEATSKIYYGIVPVSDAPESGTITHYLTYQPKVNIAHAHNEMQPGADKATLSYRIIQKLDNFMVAEIRLHTGRRHQIRAQFAAMDMPIRGDIKYGSKRTNEDGSIDLHAYSLKTIHPSTKQPIEFIAPFPDSGLWKHVILPETQT